MFQVFQNFLGTELTYISVLTESIILTILIQSMSIFDHNLEISRIKSLLLVGDMQARPTSKLSQVSAFLSSFFCNIKKMDSEETLTKGI